MNDLTKIDNIFERYYQPDKEKPIEVNFPLDERDILRLLKGVEYNQIITVGALENKPQRLHIRVFSPDRVKHISWEQWHRIVHASFSSPELMQVIKEIDNE